MTQVIPFLKKQKKFTFFAVLALVIIIIAVLAPVLAPHDPYESVLREAYQAPGELHPCGTDAMGRDLFSRILYGARISISSSFILVCIVLVTGTLLGMLAGFFGGIVDAVIMRVADTMIAFPDLILAIAIAGILGPNFVNSIIAIAAVSWTKYARIARSLVLKIKNREYISAAVTTGSGSAHILAAYMVPNALPTMVITAVTDLGTIMLSLASLSFLGFGVQPPAPEWGYMLSEGRMYMQTYPWLMIFPGLAIFVTVVVFNLLGDSLRDILDPRSKKKEIKSTQKGGQQRNEEDEKACVTDTGGLHGTCLPGHRFRGGKDPAECGNGADGLDAADDGSRLQLVPDPLRHYGMPGEERG